MQALLLGLGEEWYAIELQRVREVLPAPVITPLPHAPPAVLGVFNLRGEVVPALDTGRLLGLTPSPAGHLAVVEARAGRAALSVRAAPRRAELGEPAGAATLPAALGRFAVGGAVATLLDVDALVAAART